MSDDLEIIEELEKELGFHIRRVGDEEEGRIFYRLDVDGDVVALSLSLVGLRTTPPSIAKLTNLTQLHLWDNRLTSLPPEITQLTNLTQLHLWDNRLTSLPPEITQLTNLTQLHLGDNGLTSLPPEITQLTNLTQLDLGGNGLTSLPPEITQLTNLTQLDLRGNGLTSLPPEITQLTNLTQLDLGGNGLTSLPPEITQLTNLTQLDLGGNRLTSLPPEITQLTNLTQLDLWGNRLTSLPPEITQLTNLTQLHLWGNRLTSLPPEITQLTNLTQLDLRSNGLTSLPPEITQLTNLTQLDLGGNRLTSLPPEITQLTNLTQLHLWGNRLTSLPPEITQLTNLTQLHLWDNGLTSLPPEITQLTNLTQLDLWDNGLTSLPPEITQLTNLTQLHLWDNRLTSLPPEITQLTNLTQLHLGDNRLTSLPPEITQLTNLTQLDLGGNGLTSLPPEITQLTNLTQLDLGGNGLTSLPPEITQLTNLTQLDLGGNGLTSLPPEITQLTNLTQLDLRDNGLTSLPPEITQLTNLTQLDLRDNGLTSLPPEITQFKRLEYLNLNENPLQKPPPEIVEQGFGAILGYLRKLLDEAQAQVVNEAKLILVGQGDVGKTCLAKRLVYGTFQDEKSTEGIDILSWTFAAPTLEQENIQLNVWDFGGQEIYHATHQFFLTKRSVYLLVWNARKTKDYEHIYYWLHTIEAFGGDSPVVLVLSKCKERDDDLNMKDLKEQFPNIINLYKVDSKDGDGIEILSDVIRQTSWRLSHMQTPWIPAWFNVRERLESDARNWMEYTEYEEICRTEGLNEEQTNILDEYLHQLGVIVHFRDRSLSLRNMVVLKPEWATQAVYRVLDTQSVRERGGVLFHNELEEVWNPEVYPPALHANLLELMNEFELAYELPDERSHLVAELLPSTEPDFVWDERDNLRFFYRYDFLPASVITRFIVLVHQDLEPHDGRHLCWREGAVLLREDTRAFVKVRPVEKTIEIKICGSRKRELLAIIRNRFDHIHHSIKKVAIVEEIPCLRPVGCSHRFNYKQLLNAERQRKESVDCPVTWEEVPLSLLLDGYERREERMVKSEKNRDGEIHFHIDNSIVNRPHNELNASQEQSTAQAVQIDIDVKNGLPALQADFDKLKELLIESEPKTERKLTEIGDSLDELSPNSDKEKLNKPLNKLQRFLKDLNDENSDTHKILSGTKKGIETAQTVAKTYNKFAEWLALPQVPSVFLGKEEKSQKE